MSEGLSAVYRFETGIDTGANQAGNGRLNYVGLSGGFGNLTLGRIWSASYNHAGVIRDFPNWYTSGDTSGRVGNALSYAMSTGAFSMQIDAIMDSETNTGDAVDQLEFGMTVSLGDIGKVAFAHVNKQDTLLDEAMVVTPAVEARDAVAEVTFRAAVEAREAAPEMIFLVEEGDDGMEMTTPLTRIMVWAPEANVNDDGELTTANGILFTLPVDEEGVDDDRPASYHIGAACAPADNEGGREDGADCVEAEAFFADAPSTTVGAGPSADGMTELTVTNSRTYYAPGEQEGTGDDAMDVHTIRVIDEVEERAAVPERAAVAAVAARAAVPAVTTMIDTPGSKSSHVSAEFGLGALTGAVGYSETKTNGMSGKDKTTFVGVSGSIGDTGMNWGAWGRKKTTAGGGESKPWTVGLNKGLGDGAKAYIEHGNDGEDGSTVVGLVVNF